VKSVGRRALVVGASSGIGAALVRRLAAEGYRIAVLARRADKLDALARECQPLPGKVMVRAHDVCDVADVPKLFEELVRELGGLDFYIFAAGIMPDVGRHEYDTEKDLAMLRINLNGCIAWSNPVANYFRTQRSGTIIGISSVAGERGRKGNPVYGTSKAAMNHYLEALRNRLAETDVHVCTIKPGYVETAMTEGMGLSNMITADEAAKQILGAARDRVNHCYVPAKWRLIMAVVRSIPSFLFRRLNI
jgi:short-subunit dehydrogenase